MGAMTRIYSPYTPSNLMSITFTKLLANNVPIDLVLAAGSFYMRWLRHIRHRGTFSSMATAFENFLDAPALPQELRRQWLDVGPVFK
jgi:hypothetical protein